MGKRNVHPLTKAYIGGSTHDIRSPQAVGAVLGMLCRQPFKQRLSIAWLLLWGHRKVVKENKK